RSCVSEGGISRLRLSSPKCTTYSICWVSPCCSTSWTRRKRRSHVLRRTVRGFYSHDIFLLLPRPSIRSPLVTRSVYTKSFPSSTRHLEEVRRFVEMCCQEARLSADTVEQFKLAVDEACTNVIKHAYK